MIIDQLEGGYYHPDMMLRDPGKFSDYGFSGETMFGIDRRAGGAINTTAAGKRFWAIVDGANARYNWPWNYNGGSYRQALKDGAADIMYPEYERMATKYLSATSKAIVDSDDRLLFNFIYATWNGEGWFKRFANDFNAATAKGVTNKDELVKVAVASRTASSNSLIRQSGNKIAVFINKITTATVEYAKNNPITTVVVVLTVTAMMSYYIWAVTRKK
jgi:hypothetical protein